MFSSQHRGPVILAKILGGLAFVCLLLAFVPNLTNTWDADRGGKASRTWSLGVPSTPIIVIEQSGQGPFQEVKWESSEISVNPISGSAAFLIAGLFLATLARAEQARGAPGEVPR